MSQQEVINILRQHRFGLTKKQIQNRLITSGKNRSISSIKESISKLTKWGFIETDRSEFRHKYKLIDFRGEVI